MKNINEARYDNISEAVAFVIDFVPMIFTYDSVAIGELEQEICSRCHAAIQSKDFLAPKRNCKREHGILDNLRFALSPDLKNSLVEHFDIVEDDFRPVRNLEGDIVYYQITPKHVMLPIKSVNRIRELKPCLKCGSVQYRINEHKNEKGAPFYFVTEDALRDLHDINETFEKFNMFIPEYVVSRRVYEYLVSVNPRMRFSPMFLKKSI